MTFTIQVENYGEKSEVELCPGGADIYVTEENKEDYIKAYVKYTFETQCGDKLRSFKKGFYRVCDETLMAELFKP